MRVKAWFSICRPCASYVVVTWSPSGATVVVEWDSSDLVGRSVVLLVEDQSPNGGLAFDEVVTW